MNENEREIDLSALSPRQQAALPIVACIPTIAQAARAANVGESTLRRWLNDPAFSGCLAELRRQSANIARRKLLELTPLGVSVLADAMRDPDPSIRLRAANYTLSFNLRATELENLRSDLNNLETTINSSNKHLTRPHPLSVNLRHSSFPHPHRHSGTHTVIPAKAGIQELLIQTITPEVLP